jgi:hypothetical protein
VSLLTEQSVQELYQLTDIRLARGYLRAACEQRTGRLLTSAEEQAWDSLFSIAEHALVGLHVLISPEAAPTYIEVGRRTVE